MGTRHLVAVKLDGQYRIAQYGQWDGYPEGQGETVLKFLKNWDRPLFESKLRAAHLMTKPELEKMAEELDRHKDWSKRWPELSRDAGAGILQLVQDAPAGIKLKNSISFAADSIMCEFAYVIDLDLNVLELYRGFNKEPLPADARFYGAVEEGSSEDYQPIRILASYPLEKLPTVAKMVKACEKAEKAEA